MCVFVFASELWFLSCIRRPSVELLTKPNRLFIVFMQSLTTRRCSWHRYLKWVTNLMAPEAAQISLSLSATVLLLLSCSTLLLSSWHPGCLYFCFPPSLPPSPTSLCHVVWMPTSPSSSSLRLCLLVISPCWPQTSLPPPWSRSWPTSLWRTCWWMTGCVCSSECLHTLACVIEPLKFKPFWCLSLILTVSWR